MKDSSKNDQHLYAVMGPMCPGSTWQMAYWQFAINSSEALRQHQAQHPDVPAFSIEDCG